MGDEDISKKIGKTTDSLVYIIFCILTLGILAVLRITISIAIRKSR